MKLFFILCKNIIVKSHLRVAFLVFHHEVSYKITDHRITVFLETGNAKRERRGSKYM